MEQEKYLQKQNEVCNAHIPYQLNEIEMEKILNDTKIEFLSLSRPLIREPDLPNKFLNGESKVSKCISCNACYSTPAHRCRFKN